MGFYVLSLGGYLNTYGATLVSKNDGYGNYQEERTIYALNSALRTFDEVIYVDWASEGKSLIEIIKTSLVNRSILKYVIVTPKKAKELIGDYPNPQAVVEVLGRNIGLRRLSTDFLVSTNPDIIQPPRKHLTGFTAKDLFAPAGKRTISLFDIRPLGKPHEDLSDKLLELQPNYGQQPVVSTYDGDIWSLVSGCGDFQIAHRDVWYAIRGFEESLKGRGYADSNVQKKASMLGYRIEVDWDIPVWHIGHEGVGGGSGGWNTPEIALRDFTQITNPDTWGFSNDRSLKLKKL